MRSPRTATKSSPCSLQLEKARGQQWRPNTAKNKYIHKFIKKRGNSDKIYNMEESWGHYTQWTKPDTKGQLLYDSTYVVPNTEGSTFIKWFHLFYLYEMSRKGKSLSRKQISGCQGLGERGMGVTINGYGVLIWGNEKVLELDSDDGCTLWIYLMPLTYTLQNS